MQLFKACCLAVVVVAMLIASFYLAYAFVVLAVIGVVVFVGLIVFSKPGEDKDVRWHDEP